MSLKEKIVEMGRTEGAEEALTMCAALSVGYYGVEEEVSHYLTTNPGTTIDDLSLFIDTLIPPLEIVDDDELDEDE